MFSVKLGRHVQFSVTQQLISQTSIGNGHSNCGILKAPKRARIIQLLGCESQGTFPNCAGRLRLHLFALRCDSMGIFPVSCKLGVNPELMFRSVIMMRTMRNQHVTASHLPPDLEQLQADRVHKITLRRRAQEIVFSRGGV